MPEINMAFIWIVLAVVLGIIEAATVSLVSIWFAVGAIVAIIPAYFGAPIWVQILVFLVVSAVCFVFTKRFFKDVIKVKKHPYFRVDGKNIMLDFSNAYGFIPLCCVRR